MSKSDPTQNSTTHIQYGTRRIESIIVTGCRFQETAARATASATKLARSSMTKLPSLYTVSKSYITYHLSSVTYHVCLMSQLPSIPLEEKQNSIKTHSLQRSVAVIEVL